MNIRVKNICFKKKLQQKYYLNINREIMKLNLNQIKNSRLNLYMRSSRKN